MGLAMSCLWHELLQEAIHEADPALVELKIARAERAILLRLQDCSNGLGVSEEQALFEALGTVRALRSARRLPHRTAGPERPQHHR